MAEYGRLSSPEGELLVFPARGRLSKPATSSLKPHGTRISVPMRTGLPGDEFRSVREYHPGDNPRRIHWKASARLGKLCVRETERERSAPVVILLDARIPLSTPKSERPATREALELAISFVAETCRVALRQGNAVHLVMSCPKPTVAEIRPGQDDIRGVLEALARLEPCEDETAEALYESAKDAGLRTAWRVVGVTPTARTATGLRETMGEFIGQLHVAADPGFSALFRITGAGGGERP